MMSFNTRSSQYLEFIHFINENLEALQNQQGQGEGMDLLTCRLFTRLEVATALSGWKAQALQDSDQSNPEDRHNTLRLLREDRSVPIQIWTKISNRIH